MVRIVYMILTFIMSSVQTIQGFVLTTIYATKYPVKPIDIFVCESAQRNSVQTPEKHNCFYQKKRHLFEAR